MREMILARDVTGRKKALAKLEPMQRADLWLSTEMNGLPVTIRLLDPPLAEMQARAIFEGAVAAGKKTGKPVTAEIMLPVIFGRPEFDLVKPIIVAAAEAVAEETGVTVPYSVGTMIELPRAALRAGEIAESAEFFSFAADHLTQTTLGISRDDAASFLGVYTAKGLLPADPFVSIDTSGVGELVKIAVERGRAARPGIKLGICGEHGGNQASITFCKSAHLDYVSCSPFRVPDRAPCGGAGGARTQGAFDGLIAVADPVPEGALARAPFLYRRRQRRRRSAARRQEKKLPDPTAATTAVGAEHERIGQSTVDRANDWKAIGAYLSERAGDGAGGLQPGRRRLALLHPTSTVAPVPIAGAKTGSRASATAPRRSASRWRCGTGATPTSRSECSASPVPRATMAKTSRNTGGTSTRRRPRHG